MFDSLRRTVQDSGCVMDRAWNSGGDVQVLIEKKALTRVDPIIEQTK